MDSPIRTSIRKPRRPVSIRRQFGVGLAVVSVFFTVAAGFAQSGPTKELHLYLLAGQSNMAGRGVIAGEDTTRHLRVFALSAGMTWRLAREPLHFDKLDIVGVGPGFAFGKAMADSDTSIVIGLIPAAVGGSRIESWRPGEIHSQTNSRPYDDAVSRTFRVLALYDGSLKGIIWHQGEANRDTPPDEYRAELVDLIDRFRSDFRRPNLPFVAAPLAPYFVDRNPSAAAINDVIRGIPNLVDNTAVVETGDMTPKADNVHLDADSARKLGRRYAEAMKNLREKDG